MPTGDEPVARIARLEQRVTDLDLRVSALTPAMTTVTELSVHVATLRSRFDEFSRKIDKRDEAHEEREKEREREREQREDETRRDRRAMIRWAIGLTIMIVCALIGALAVIISAGGHP